MPCQQQQLCLNLSTIRSYPCTAKLCSSRSRSLAVRGLPAFLSVMHLLFGWTAFANCTIYEFRAIGKSPPPALSSFYKFTNYLPSDARAISHAPTAHTNSLSPPSRTSTTLLCVNADTVLQQQSLHCPCTVCGEPSQLFLAAATSQFTCVAYNLLLLP